MRAERGSVMIFVAGFVLPLFWVIYTLTLDLGGYFTEAQRVQKSLDDAAMHGARFLPFPEVARGAAERALARGGLTAHTTISASADELSLLYTTSHPFAFPALLGLNAALPLRLTARTRGTPYDVFIALDLSSYLAPAIVNGIGAPWGNSGSWPPAQFFATSFSLPWQGHPIDPRLLTQQCFNPAISSLKRAALETFEHLGAFRMNTVGVALYPGTGSEVTILHPVTPAAGPGGVSFLTNAMLYPGLRNEHCAAAAEQEVWHEAYRFPEANRRLPPEERSGTPEAMILPPSWDFNPAWASQLLLREVIWSSGVRGERGDLGDLLTTMRAELLGAPARPERGGLVNEVLKSGIVLAGDVPWVGDERFPAPGVLAALEARLGALREDIAATGARLKLYYVVFAHEGNTGVAGLVPALRDFFAGQELASPEGSLEIELLYGADPAFLADRAVSAMILDRRTEVIAR